MKSNIYKMLNLPLEEKTAPRPASPLKRNCTEDVEKMRSKELTQRMRLNNRQQSHREKLVATVI